MSLDKSDYNFGSEELELIEGSLELTAEEVLEMSEPEYRRHLLSRKMPITEPHIKSIENSMSRERERLEDYFSSTSGAEKWLDIWNSLGPRWAEVISMYDERSQTESNIIVPMEKKYTKDLKNNFSDVDKLSKRLRADFPHETDIQNFANEYKRIEDRYEVCVKPNIGPEDLVPR